MCPRAVSGKASVSVSGRPLSCQLSVVAWECLFLIDSDLRPLIEARGALAPDDPAFNQRGPLTTDNPVASLLTLPLVLIATIFMLLRDRPFRL
jgi:hypothetical protein